MIIRPATNADLPALLKIGKAFFSLNPFRETSAVIEADLEQTLRYLMHSHVLIVAELDGRVVGTVGAVIAPLFWNFQQLQAEEFFWWSDKSVRGRGVGTQLREALHAALKARNVQYMIMAALAESPPHVEEAYLRAGMRKVETKYMKELN